MVLAMKCMVCSSVRLIDRLDPKDKVEVCEVCGHREVLLMKSYDWNSLQDVDMDIVRKDEEDFDDVVGEFADEETGEEYDDEEEECGDGADVEECETCPHFEYCMGVDSPDVPKATCVEIKGMRTFQDLDKRGCVVEVCASKDGKDVYVYYENDGNCSLFRVCDKSYLEYMEYGEDDEVFPIHVFKEIRNEIRKEDKEFFPLFNLVMDIGERITRGIAMPNLYE